MELQARPLVAEVRWEHGESAKWNCKGWVAAALPSRTPWIRKMELQVSALTTIFSTWSTESAKWNCKSENERSWEPIQTLESAKWNCKLVKNPPKLNIVRIESAKWNCKLFTLPAMSAKVIRIRKMELQVYDMVVSCSASPTESAKWNCKMGEKTYSVKIYLWIRKMELQGSCLTVVLSFTSRNPQNGIARHDIRRHNRKQHAESAKWNCK